MRPAELRRLSRAGMRSYLRYYCEAFRLPDRSAEQIRAGVRVEGDDPVRAELAAGRPALCFLGHLGNWELGGAYLAARGVPLLEDCPDWFAGRVLERFAHSRVDARQICRLCDDAGIDRPVVSQPYYNMLNRMPETEQLPAGQKPFDISIVGGGKGLIGGIAGAVPGARRNTIAPLLPACSAVSCSLPPSQGLVLRSTLPPTTWAGRSRTRISSSASTHDCAATK